MNTNSKRKNSVSFSKLLQVILFVVCCTGSSIAWGQETLTVHDGTEENKCIPMYVAWFDDYTRSQFVIPANDLTDMAGGTISQITFYVKNTNIPYTTLPEVDIYMTEVASTTISSFVAKSSATIVYTGTVSFQSTGIATITLDTPYQYTGGNLLIGCENISDDEYKFIYFYGETVTGASIAGYDGTSTANVTATQRDFIPKTTFTYTHNCTQPTGNFAFSPSSSNLLIGNNLNISTNLTNTLPSGGSIAYTSSNTGVATVNASGVVTGVAEGSATITAKWTHDNFCSKSATFTVNVNDGCLRIGDGTTGCGTAPLHGLYNHSWSQMIYTATEIGQIGDIYSIAFEASAENSNARTTTIYMGMTTKSTFSSNTDFINSSELTLVWSGTWNIAQGWNQFTLNTPFIYSDGSKNLVIAFACDGSWSGTSFNGTSTSGNTVIYASDDSNAPTTTNMGSWSGTNKSTSTSRPNVKICIESCTDPNFSLSSTSGSVLVTNTKDISSYLQNTQGATPTYTSNGTGVATVDANGVITGVSTGSTTITVSIPANGDYCAATATYTIDVTCEEPTLTLSETTGSALIGENKTVTLTNPSNANVTWTATNASVATVTGNNTGATIHAVGNGTTTIKASIPASGTNCAKEVTYTITVSCTSRTFTFNQSSVNCGVGSSVSAPGYTVSGGNGTVTYSSSNTSVATVNANTGIVTGVAEGSATITATISASAPYCSQTATFIVNVSPCGFTTKTIGTGTSKSYIYAPVDNYYKYTYTQIIYTSGELTAGTIYSIAFQYAYTSAMTKKTNVVIYMGETTKNAFNSDTDWITSGLTQVYSGNLNCSNGWNWFALNNPFNYSGTKNLVVVIDDNSNNYNSDSYTFYYSSTTGNKFISYYSDTNNYNNTSISGHNSSIRNNNRPNTKFCIAKQYTLTYEAGTTTCDGTASNEPAPLTRPEGSVVQISFQRPTCSNTRCTFVGWATNEDGTGTVYQPGDQYTLNSDVTLYAKYRKCTPIANFAIDAENENYTQTIDGIPYFSICLDNEITLKTSPSSIANVAKCKWYINAHDGNAPTSETRSGLWNKTYTPSTETGHDVSLVVTKTDGCAYYASARIKVSAGLSPTNSTPDAGEICIGSGKDITVGTQAAGSTIEVEDAPIEVSAVLGEGVETFIPDGPNCDQGLCYESAVTFYDFDEAATIETANNINYVRINMEHSHIGDMQIKLTCPNGQSAILLEDANTSSQSLDEYSYDWPYNVIYCYGLFNIYNNVGGDGNCSKGTSLGQDYKEIYVIKNGNTYSATGVRQEATAFTGTLSNALREEYIVYLRGLIAAQSVPADFCYGDKYYEFDSYVVTNPNSYTTTATSDNYYGGYNLSNYVRRNMWCTDVASLGFGKPNVLDGVAAENVCNSTYNHPGTGLDYCWSNNSTYTYAGGTHGYVHETANHQVGYTNSMVVKPSNMTDMTQIYHPKESFDGLIGCPLNGTWKISVCDSWRFDNGYIFNWELALNDVTLNSWDYTISLADVEVETDNIVSATSTPSVFNIHPTEANANSIIGVEQNNSITLIDNLGCRNEGIGFTYTVTQPVIPAVINETICLGTSVDLTASNGSSTSSAATAPYTYAWSTDASLSANNTQTVTATPTWTSTYTVSMTDNAGCSGTNLATVSVTAPAQQETSDYFIWTGKGTNNTNWGDADNWAKYNYANTRYENVTGAPTSADNVYVIGNSTCTTTSPTVNVDGAAKNLKIGNGFSVNGGSHNLSLAGNLDMYATNSFVPATGKVSFIGNSDQTINKAITFYDVVFNQNSVNTITAPSMTINHNATFTKGIVNNDVSFIANSTVTNANTLTYDSYVDGTVTKTTGSSVAETFTFPTGGDLTNDPTNFVLGTVKTEIPKNQEVSVKFNHKSTDGGFTTGDMPKWWGASSMCSAEVNGSDDLPRIDHASNAEFWEITTPITLSNVTMTAYSEDGDILQFNENTQDHNASSIVGTVYNSSYYCWQNMGGTATVSSVTRSGQYNKISLSGFSIPAGGGGFTTFGSLNGNTILPIELKDFYAECNGNNVATVEWTTATEHDNDYFILERSHDAKNFTEIARIQGAGYSASEKFYQYIDNKLYSGDNYYRLVQVDFDGVKTTSEIITIKCNETFGDPNVEAYPNPFNNEITVVLENFGNVPAQIEVFDVLGKLIRVEKIESTLDEYITTYDFSNLAPATYNMRVSTSDFVIVKQIIKQ